MTQARHRQDRRGTISGWVKDRCKCEKCEAAWRAYCNKRYRYKDPKTFGPDRQSELLRLVTDGATIADAAKQIGVSKSTVTLLARSRAKFRIKLDMALRSGERHQRDRPGTRVKRFRGEHGTESMYVMGCHCDECLKRAGDLRRLRQRGYRDRIRRETRRHHGGAVQRRRRTVLDEDAVNRVRELWYSPVTVVQIGVEMGVTQATIYRWARQIGLPVPRPKGRPPK